MSAPRSGWEGRRLIVLKQIEGPRWAVVVHEVKGGKRQFAGRIATARDYAPAARIAMQSAAAMRLHLAIEGRGMMLRQFDRTRDAPAMEARS